MLYAQQYSKFFGFKQSDPSGLPALSFLEGHAQEDDCFGGCNLYKIAGENQANFENNLRVLEMQAASIIAPEM